MKQLLKNKISFEKIMMGLFMIVTLVLFGWYNMSKPRILILHSYDKSYAWVRDINIGLNRTLNSRYLYQVNWYYMDTKRHPFADFKNSAGIAARNVIKQTKPDIVIAIDDDAQQYAAKYFINDPQIKIVFAGINNQAEDYGYDKANNVTGILERLPLSAIRETLESASNFKSLNRPIRIAYLGDESPTVRGDIKQIQNFNWAPEELVTIKQVKTWPEWQQAIQTFSTTVDVVVVTGYRGLSRSANESALVPPQEVIEWTDTNAAIPVISGNGFFTEDGGMLAIGTSPYEQGEVAAAKALDILFKGKNPADLPFRTSEQFIVTMSDSKMKRHHFELPSVYESAARTGDKYFP
jgi:ABC-type uncharacterized transport system substrate-binding protein